MTSPVSDSASKPTVTIYTDGAAEPNPGPGGYGVVLISGKHRRELSGGFQLTTNNRMELLAVIVGLEALTKPCDVTVYSDSKYIVDSYQNGAAAKWRANNWFRTKNSKAKNSDLWKRLLDACAQHTVTLSWVPGHKGIEENERCDQLAVAAAQSPVQEVDEGYEPPEGHATLPTMRPAIRPTTPGTPTVTHTEPGEPCRKCGTPLIRRESKRKKANEQRAYVFDWYLYCPGCATMYMVEAAKRMLDDGPSLLDHVEDERDD